MPWNGSGTFSRIYSWVADKAAGLDIIASRMDTDTDDIAASGFGNCLTRDGQGQPTANLPMAGFRHTGAANGINPSDYATLQQIKNGWGGVVVNLGLQASVSGGVLTVALKTADGTSDPSATNPIYIPFRDTTLTAGDPVIVAVAAATSISTFATGATLGASNSTPFRLWLVAFNNSGTAVLALINCSSGQIVALNEGALANTTAMTGGATSAATFYTPNGTTLASKAYRILGYVEYAAGLATAGTYATAPTTVQVFGPGIKKPGDIVQVIYTTTSSSTTATGSNTYMGVGANIAAVSPVNWIASEFTFAWQVNSSSSGTFFVSRGTGPTSLGVTLQQVGNASVGFGSASHMKVIDTATTATRSQYNLYCSGTGIQVLGTQSITVTEIMG